MKTLDEKDIIILKIIDDKKRVGYFELTKILNPSLKDNRKISDKSVNILQKCEKLIRYGYLNKEDKTYSLNNKNIKFVGDVVLNIEKKKVLFDNMLMLKDNRSWILLQLT